MIFSSSQSPDRLWDSHSLLFNMYRDIFPGVKRSGSVADHSHPSTDEELCGATPPLPYVFTVWYLIK
jgi:hypothetical protein